MVIQYSDDVASAMEAASIAVEKHAHEIGLLALEWAHLDSAIDGLFEPLLDCSEAQVACILVENIAARCEMLKRLLYTVDLPAAWTEWALGLLDRAANELASQRNRMMHDVWRFKNGVAVRTDKRAKVGKAQAREPAALSYNTQHAVNKDDIARLRGRVSTVAVGLQVATKALFRWRLEKQTPELDPQWLQASTRNARCLNFQVNLVAFEKPPIPLEYAFDAL